jgi:hypothetical protein
VAGISIGGDCARREVAIAPPVNAPNVMAKARSDLRRTDAMNPFLRAGAADQGAAAGLVFLSFFGCRIVQACPSSEWVGQTQR